MAYLCDLGVCVTEYMPRGNLQVSNSRGGPIDSAIPVVKAFLGELNAVLRLGPLVR